MKYVLVLAILGVVAAQIVFAQNGDQQQTPGSDHGMPEAPGPKLALHRFRRQMPQPSGQMGGGGSIGFGAGGQAGGQAGGGGEAGADGQAGASAQFGFGAQAGGGAGGGAGLN